MKRSTIPRHFPLYIHISSLFLVLILLIGGSIGWVSYKLSREIIETTADDLTGRVNREISSSLKDLNAPIKMAGKLLSHSAASEAKSLETRLARLGFFSEVLDLSDALSSLYIAYDYGDFFLVRRIHDEAERLSFKAPAGTHFIVQSIERNVTPVRGRFLYLDAKSQFLAEEERPDYPDLYDARTRDWYRDAMGAKGQVLSEPYVFFTNHKVGATFAVRSQSGHAVVGADIQLDTLGKDLTRQKITPGTQIALLSSTGLVIAHESISKLVENHTEGDVRPRLKRLGELASPVLAQIEPILKNIGPKESYSRVLSINDANWHIFINPIERAGSASLHLLIAIPEQELLATAFKLRTTAALLTLGILLLAIPLTWFTARRIAGSLQKLGKEAESIRHFEFEQPILLHSRVKEVNDLALTMSSMKQSIHRFLEIIRNASEEKDFDRLLPMLLGEMITAADATSGIFYRLEKNKNQDEDILVPAAFCRADGKKFTDALPTLSLRADSRLFERALKEGYPQCDDLTPTILEALGLAQDTAVADARQAVTVPLLNRQKQLVGTMLLLRKTPIGSAQISFVRALSGAASSALETLELIKAQKELFEAFIQLIAGAIDAKSPHTGGHCARVPVLTKMLAEAACAETSGPLGNFSLDEDDWEAVHVASWLHDCGKITTPEYIFDKATKLETIYDRIHEVRMRFEVLKRDAEIASLKAIAAGHDADVEHARFANQLRQIDADFSFVASCNIGGESMSTEKIERLKAIATQTWVRTLDDRIGIAHEEKTRKEGTPAPTLPTSESLLADKAEHCVERRAQDRIADDNPLGFRMDVPPLQSNKGELYNLSITRGTLTTEERYKINEHIVQTLVMLAQLPFPKHLRKVPEMVGGHHEKMDGTGYPKRLTHDEMSPMARMMAIADIFEALTAVDRPYKKGKTLSESIEVMSLMKQTQHIDPDLFDLFLRSGVYQQYAERFMLPEQIDAVDVARYLSPP